MTFRLFALKLLRKFAAVTNLPARAIIILVSRGRSRKWLNEWYNSLQFDEKRVFHSIFSEVFRKKTIDINQKMYYKHKYERWKTTRSRKAKGLNDFTG